MSTNRLLLVTTPPIFSYCSNLALDGEFRSLIFTAARAVAAVCTAVRLLSLSCDLVSDSSDLDSWLSFSSGCLVGIEDSVADLTDQVGNCSIVRGYDSNTTSSVSAWKEKCPIDWITVLSVATGRWIPFDNRSGVVRGLPAVGIARVMIDDRNKFVPLAPSSEVSLLHLFSLFRF